MNNILEFKRPTPLGERLHRALDKQQDFLGKYSMGWQKLSMEHAGITAKLNPYTKLMAPQSPSAEYQKRNFERDYFILAGTVRELRKIQRAIDQGREYPGAEKMLVELEDAIDELLEN